MLDSTNFLDGKIGEKVKSESYLMAGFRWKCGKSEVFWGGWGEICKSEGYFYVFRSLS